jgi:hypothetical protein
MALTFKMRVTGLCSGIIDAGRKRVDTVLLNANTTMPEIPYHLQTLLIDSRYVVSPPGLLASPGLASHRGRIDADLYKIPDGQFTAWDLNGAIVRVCENGVPIANPALTIAEPVATGECCADDDWSDMHWVLDVADLAASVNPDLRIDPDWRTIGPMTLAIFEMLKGKIYGADPYYDTYAYKILSIDGQNTAQTYTDTWMYEYASSNDDLLLQIDRGGVMSYIACRVPAGGGTVPAVLLNEGVPRPGAYASEPDATKVHMLAYYDLVGAAGAKVPPADRKKLVLTNRSCKETAKGSTALGDGSFCMSTMFSQRGHG